MATLSNSSSATLPEPDTLRGSSLTVVKTGTQSADDPFEFVMSTADVDRVGDTIDQAGWELAEFRKNPIALWQHASGMPIGTWKKVRVDGGQLRGFLELAKAGTSRFIDTVRSLIEQRIMRAVSVGFAPLEYEERRGKGGEWLGINFKKQLLVECSLVSVPANGNALAVARSFGMDALDVRALFEPSDPELTLDRVKDFSVITPASQQLLQRMPAHDALARAAAAVTKANAVKGGSP